MLELFIIILVLPIIAMAVIVTKELTHGIINSILELTVNVLAKFIK